MSSERPAQPGAAAPPAERLPLSGIRIVDFGWVYAAPIATRTVADMGAEVIKIETMGHLDELRMSPSNTARDIEKDPVFHDINRNKLSASIDFSKPAGKELVKRLVAASGVVVENYSPRVMEKQGLGFEDLLTVRSDLIMLSMSAAGQTGPLRDIRTYGPSISALSGLDSMVGYVGERVLGSQGFYPDMVGAIHGVISLLAAIWHRDRTGRGQYIDLSQWEATVGMLGDAMMDFTMSGKVRSTQGNRVVGASPHGNYPCREPDTWVAISVSSQEEWRGAREAMGDPEWTREPWAADPARRVEHAAAIDSHVAEWTRTVSAEQAVEALQGAGVPAGPSLHVGERYFHPHFAAREFHVDIDHPATGTDIVGGVPWRFSDTPGGVRAAAPLFGQHNEYVFGEILGLDEGEIRDLRDQSVIG